MTPFRTSQELKRAQWAEKFQSVTEGKLYSTTGHSPFPIHEYFKLGLLGKNIRMLEINAGHSIVENMVSDTLTQMKIDLGNDTLTQEVQEWLDEIDYDELLDSAMRAFYGDGYGVQQVYRLLDDDENGYTVATIDPATWYPEDPGLLHKKVTKGRIISVFCEQTAASKAWYALIESHEIGEVSYELRRLDGPDALDGALVPLTTIPRFAGLQDTPTDLEALPVIQINRSKSSGYIFGTSVLQPIWGILQEVSEIQTQIRQERIKHFRSRLAVPRTSLQPADRDTSALPRNSKQTPTSTDDDDAGKFSVTQDIFPIPNGGPIPAYIQWDMAIIEAGSKEIDNLLSRAAAVVGCPRSIFNLDEGANIHVDTDRRKDRRYVRKIMQGQRRASQLVSSVIAIWLKWNEKGDENTVIDVSFASPFDLSKEETLGLMREMNPNADFVSQKEGIDQLWPEKTPEERAAMLKEIEDEQRLSAPPPNSALGNVADKIQL